MTTVYLARCPSSKSVRGVGVGRCVVAQEYTEPARTFAVVGTRVAVVGEVEVCVLVTVVVTHRKTHTLLTPVSTDRGY